MNSQPRDTCGYLRNNYNCFSHVCQWNGKLLCYCAFWLLVCFNVCFGKCKVTGQQIADRVAKSFLGFGPRFEDPSAVSWLHVLISTHHQLSAPWQKWGMGSESGKQKPEPRVAPRGFSIGFVQWGVLCFVLRNPHETQAEKGASDLRLRGGTGEETLNHGMSPSPPPWWNILHVHHNLD